MKSLAAAISGGAAEQAHRTAVDILGAVLSVEEFADLPLDSGI